MYTGWSVQIAEINGGAGVCEQYRDKSNRTIIIANGKYCSNYDFEVKALLAAIDVLIKSEDNISSRYTR